jgi:hypothetical protein
MGGIVRPSGHPYEKLAVFDGMVLRCARRVPVVAQRFAALKILFEGVSERREFGVDDPTISPRPKYR